MEFHSVGIVGGGFVGKSLAQKVASKGIHVTVLERSEETVARARQGLVANLDAELAKWGITASEKKVVLDRVTFTTEPAGLAATDIVIEAVQEDLAAKKTAMQQLGAVCPPGHVFVTNTSTLSITEIAAASGRPDHVIGMHFMVPVTRSPIVEVVRGADTSDATFQTALALAGVLDKTPITVFESPGYVVTRAILPMLNEAMHIVLEGVASAKDVDRAIQLGYEFKFGPLEFSDRMGLDRVLGWLEHMFRETGDVKYRPCPLLRKLVRAGHLGRRTGRGFFRYQGHERLALEGEEALL
jgi:3-hydroxybutyryl-CoA dehydrogenase